MLVAAAWFVRADRFVRHGALAPFHAVVHAELADRAERLVIERRHTQRRAQLFIESAQVMQVHGQRGNLQSFVGQEKFLIPGVPQPGELPLQHDRGQNRHLVAAIASFAEFGAATVLLDAHHAPCASYGKS